MKILGIETSCDETGISIIEASGNISSPHFEILGDALNSQIEIHKEYGGVFPNLAKREHQKNLVPLLKIALEKAGMLEILSPTHPLSDFEDILEREHALFELFKEVLSIQKPDIDYIAVTYGPGLEPALWVGINFARALSRLWNIPLIPTNHMEGHIASVLFEATSTLNFPAIALLVSGGHTELDLVQKWGDYEHIGQTRDDALGEAFDKVARLLDLPYPGGPEISKIAQIHRERYANYQPKWDMPRPMIHSGDYDFSFSGIKTAVLYKVKEKQLTPEQKQEIAREFEDAVIEVIVSKTQSALEEYGIETLIVGGGVIANKLLREKLLQLPLNVHIPQLDLTGDNATMICMAAFLHAQSQTYGIAPDIRAEGNAHL